MRFRSLLTLSVVAVVAIVPSTTALPSVQDDQTIARTSQDNELPATATARWGSSNGRGAWTEFAWQAVNEHGSKLWAPGFQPTDMPRYCPAYGQGTETDRKLFWVGLMSSLAKFESAFRPEITYQEDFNRSDGRPVISRGLLQISQESANGYGCGITDERQLHDPRINISCAVRILNRQVPRSNVIAARQGGRWRGAASYWSPFRNEEKRADLARWVARQPYCVSR